MYSTLQFGEKWRRRGRGEAVTSHKWFLLDLKKCGFSSSLLFLITLTSVLLIRPICDGSTITYRRYIHLAMQIDNTLDDTWYFAVQGIHWRGTAKSKWSGGDLGETEWRFWRMMKIVSVIRTSPVHWTNRMLFHPRINKASTTKRHVVERRILSSRFPALPNQSIATGRWVQPNRIFQTRSSPDWLITIVFVMNMWQTSLLDVC